MRGQECLRKLLIWFEMLKVSQESHLQLVHRVLRLEMASSSSDLVSLVVDEVLDLCACCQCHRRIVSFMFRSKSQI